jgi:hypothetical protein
VTVPGSITTVATNVKDKSNKTSKMVVLWVVAQCSLVKVYQRFRGPCCLHHQDDE